MSNNSLLDKIFADLLYQLSKGNTFENIAKGQTIIDLEQVKEWKNKFGYTFNIYSNDHFINKKPHFHLDNKSSNISTKISFEGEILEQKGKNRIDKKTLKALKYFLNNPNTRRLLIAEWNKSNPELKWE
tara:strand:+ start:524 stop:910 length:387 start_codon:yes stop_codon:yes gene_type:complete